LFVLMMMVVVVVEVLLLCIYPSQLTDIHTYTPTLTFTPILYYTNSLTSRSPYSQRSVSRSVSRAKAALLSSALGCDVCMCVVGMCICMSMCVCVVCQAQAAGSLLILHMRDGQQPTNSKPNGPRHQ
jgi:hypothetical protein